MSHLAAVTSDLLQRMIETIVGASHPDTVILFGSHARGTAGSNSDVDLLIVEGEPFGPGRSRRDETTRLYHLLRRFRVPLDLLLFSRQEVDEWRSTRNHVVGRALQEGKVLYARP